jgi:hypothetical protein
LTDGIRNHRPSTRRLRPLGNVGLLNYHHTLNLIIIGGTDRAFDADNLSTDQRFEPPQTPTSDSDNDHNHGVIHDDSSDDEDDGDLTQDSGPKRKPGGYDSRIEQILYENPKLSILITDAGKSIESGGRYIVYTIKTGDLEVRRRYSEFASLRDALTRLHPTLIVPPIPEKHTMADYAANPTNAKQDQQIIDLRKRMLAVFLNRCRRMEEIRTDGVWWRFLDPNASWVGSSSQCATIAIGY